MSHSTAALLRSLWSPIPSTARTFPRSSAADTSCRRGGAVIPALDSLRGIAIVLVFLVHAEGVVNWTVARHLGEPISWWRAFSLGGHTGVSLFFVLSGFLLVRPFAAEIAAGPRVDATAYCLRRVWRIMPLYALVVLTTAIVFASTTSISVLRAVPYLLMLNAFVPDALSLPAPVSGPWWSLATEAQFYTLLPLLPLAFRSRRAARIGGVVAAAYAIAYVLFACQLLPLGGAVRLQLGCSFFGRGPVFLFGGLAGVVYERWGDRLTAWAARRRWVRAGGADVALITLVVLLGTLLAWVTSAFKYVELEIRHPEWRIVEGLVWSSILLLCLLAPLRIRPLLVNRVLGTIGKLSYSIYLLHLPMMWYGFTLLRMSSGPGVFVGWVPATILATSVIALVCLGCAAVTYALVERPGLRMGARAVAMLARRRAGRDRPMIVPQPVTALVTSDGEDVAKAA